MKLNSNLKGITKKDRIKLFIFSTLLSANFIFYVIYQVSDYFTGFGFNESVIYHVFYGIQGFDISLYLTQLIYLVIIITLVIIFLYAIPFRYFGKFKFKNLMISALIVLLGFQPLTNNILTLTGSSMFSRSFIGNLDPEFNESIKIPHKKNIIYIYAESLEGTFLNEGYFPGLLPNLNNLKKQALSLSNINQVYGTGNTIAGMVASQCGVPFDSHGISSPDAPFMPKLYCLGDILAENQYHLNYMGGASLKFAGKGNFYKTHGFQSVTGKEKLLSALNDKNYVSKWGIYDDILFSQAQLKLSELTNQQQPFALFLLTLDTHYPDNLPSKACNGVKYLDGSDSYLNTVHCSDMQISNFVKKVMQSDLYNNTLIIIASDHLNPNSKIFSEKGISERRDMFLVLGKEITPKELQKMATTMDITPTLLSLLGTNIERNNLGTNLFSLKATQIAQHAELSKMLYGWSYQLKKFN